jgi:hypothetical protein
MRSTEDAERQSEARPEDVGARRLLIEAGMLAILVGLALAFLAGAPS